MTTLQSLRSLSAYPVSSATIENIAEEAGIAADTELTPEVRKSAAYKRAKAHTYLYLASAPNISQNGVSFSFSSEERKRFMATAKQLLQEIGDDTSCLGSGQRYGYMGENF